MDASLVHYCLVPGYSPVTHEGQAVFYFETNVSLKAMPRLDEALYVLRDRYTYLFGMRCSFERQMKAALSREAGNPATASAEGDCIESGRVTSDSV